MLFDSEKDLIVLDDGVNELRVERQSHGKGFAITYGGIDEAALPIIFVSPSTDKDKENGNCASTLRIGTVSVEIGTTCSPDSCKVCAECGQ